MLHRQELFVSQIFYGVSGGLCAGSLVGIFEASWVLTSTVPSEYQAIRYGAVLYGLAGALLGAGFGLVFGTLAHYIWLSAIRIWAIAFFGTISGMGGTVLYYLLDRQLYMEKGIPNNTIVGLGGGLGFFALLGITIGANVLGKTPLRVLPTLKGTAAAWCGLVGLAGLFSMAPAPGGAGVLVPGPTQGAEFEEKPDIILIMIDSLRADALGSYGAGADASPNLDALGQEGVIFDQFITSASWTRASTASLFSSRFPSSHGCESKKAVLSDSVVTLAESLSNAGFATGGLPDNANISGSVGFSQGFSWYPYLPRYPFYAAESSFSLSLYSLLHRFYVRLPIKKKIEDYYLPAPAQLAKAQEFIEANQNSRWFLFIHLMDPHDPYFRHPWDGDSVGRAATSAPEASQKDQIKELYAGEVHYLDEALGEFIDWLQRSGRYDSSLIIVTSDHGEEFLEHGGWWHGSTLYDEQIRVPLLIKLPAGERAGIRVPWQVHQVDIAPTITELAGIGAGEGWQGQSLFGDDFDSKLAFGNPNAEEDPQGEEELPSGPVVVGWEQHPASREAISEQDFEGYRLRSIRWKGAKYIETLAAPPGNARNQLPQSLYDLLVDPAEQTTLIGQGNPKEAELKDRLDRELEEIEQGALPKGSREISCSEAQVLVQLGYLPELPPACLQGP